MDCRALPARVQVVVVPAHSCRHEAGNSSCAVPVVVVLSVYDPSEFATHVPLTCTWSDSVVIDAVEQPKISRHHVHIATHIQARRRHGPGSDHVAAAGRRYIGAAGASARCSTATTRGLLAAAG